MVMVCFSFFGKMIGRIIRGFFRVRKILVVILGFGYLSSLKKVVISEE